LSHRQPFAFQTNLVRRDDAWRFLHGTPNIPLCDYRPGAGIRFSLHFHNRDDELDAAMAANREIRATGAWRAFTTGKATVT